VLFAALGTVAMLAFLLRAPAHAWNGPDLWPAAALGVASMGCVVASRFGEAEDRGPWGLLWCAAWTALGAWNAFLPLLGACLAGLFTAVGLWRVASRPLEPSGAAPEAFRWPRLGALLMAALLAKPLWDWGLAPSGAWLQALVLASAAGWARIALRPPPRRHREGLLILGAALAATTFYLQALPWAWALVAGSFGGSLWHRRPASLSARSFALPVLLGTAVSFALHANLWIPGLAQLLGWRA
jgi:hypothetical protein